jgi:F5/8 type C domain
LSAPAFIQNAYAALVTQTRDLLLLESAERKVRAFAPAQQQTIRSLFEAATMRSAVADDLTDAHNTVPALILYREAAELFILALLVSRDPSLDIEAVEAGGVWKQLADLAEKGDLGPLPPSFEEATTVLRPMKGRLALDELSPEELAAKRALVETTVGWLRGLLEPRSLRDLRWSRTFRITAAIAIVGALLVWGLSRIFSSPNIALNKPVSVSSRHPLSSAPPDGSGLVNGTIEPSYGIQTTKDASAWVMVDLQDIYKVSKVKVYNRGDGWFDEGLPFVLELSENGKDFTEVDRRTQSFSQISPWTYSAKGRAARYVRIRTPASGYIALSELEVTGKK